MLRIVRADELLPRSVVPDTNVAERCLRSWKCRLGAPAADRTAYQIGLKFDRRRGSLSANPLKY
jgi:hypothetical protein